MTSRVAGFPVNLIAPGHRQGKKGGRIKKRDEGEGAGRIKKGRCEKWSAV